LKFKYLIIAFSIIAVIIILFTVFLPRLLERTEFTIMNIWGFVIPFLSFVVLILVFICTFFFLNYRLLSLLEREDWPALAYYLEQKIYVKKQYKPRFIRLLASSYLVISDFQSVIKLESKAILTKPSVVNKYALVFGSARILSGNYGQAAAFFKTQMEKSKGKDQQWLRWFYGFSHLLAGAFNTAEPEFSSLAVSSNNAMITGLSAYFLNRSIEKYSLKPAECRGAAESGRQRILDTLKNIENWKKETGKYGTDIHIAIIRKYVDETGKWLFNKDKEPVAEIVKEKTAAEPGEKRAGERRKGDRRSDKRYTSDRRTGDRRNSQRNAPRDEDNV